MARIVVHVHDHPFHPDQRPGHRVLAGDIIDVVPDDHVFSHGEINCGQFHIIDVPGVDRMDLAHLLERKINEDGLSSGLHVRKLDHSKLHVMRQRKPGHWTGDKAIDRKALDDLVISREH